MIVKFNEKFDKDLSKLNKETILKVFEKISVLKNSDNLISIIGIRKLSGYKYYYRIGIGDYRMGFSYDAGVITLERFLHRKDIYNNFPK